MTSSSAYITEIPYIFAYLEQLNVLLTDISSNYSFVVILTFSVLPKPGFCRRWFECNDTLSEQLWTLQTLLNHLPWGSCDQNPVYRNCSLLSISWVKARNDSHKVDVFYSIPHQRLLAKLKRWNWWLANPLYHSMQMFLPFHWPRAHHVTCKTEILAAPR